MLNLLKTFLGSFILILVLIGCEENTVNPDVNDNDNLRLDKRGKVVEKVTGSGHFTTGQGDFRTFSFNARKYEDGSFAGSYVRTRRNNGVTTHFKGDITCFTIDGDEVWFAGIETEGIFSTPPNNGAAWHVVDNGEGNNSPPDQVSAQFVLRTLAEVETYCLSKGTAPAILAGGPPLNEIEAGNIQIH